MCILIDYNYRKIILEIHSCFMLHYCTFKKMAFDLAKNLSNNPIFICDICGSYFSLKSNYLKHMPSHYDCLSELDIQIIQFTTITNGYTNLKELLDTNFELGSLLLENESKAAAGKTDKGETLSTFPLIKVENDMNSVAILHKEMTIKIEENVGSKQRSINKDMRKENSKRISNNLDSQHGYINQKKIALQQETYQSLKRKSPTENCSSAECKRKRNQKIKVTPATTKEHLPVLSLHRQASRSSPRSTCKTKVG